MWRSPARATRCSTSTGSAVSAPTYGSRFRTVTRSRCTTSVGTAARRPAPTPQRYAVDELVDDRGRGAGRARLGACHCRRDVDGSSGRAPAGVRPDPIEWLQLLLAAPRSGHAESRRSRASKRWRPRSSDRRRGPGRADAPRRRVRRRDRRLERWGTHDQASIVTALRTVGRWVPFDDLDEVRDLGMPRVVRRVARRRHAPGRPGAAARHRPPGSLHEFDSPEVVLHDRSVVARACTPDSGRLDPALESNTLKQSRGSRFGSAARRATRSGVDSTARWRWSPE